MEILPENRRILGRKGLRLQPFLVRNVQIDAKNNFLLGFNVVRTTCGNKQNRMYTDLHIPVGRFYESTT